jgi:hypothetical protein
MSETAARNDSRSSNDTDGHSKSQDQCGHSAKDDRSGPGSPFGRQVAALRSALLASVTAQDIQDVMAALLVQAKKGNVAAARLFLAYTIGKPADGRDRERSDIEEESLPQQPAAPADKATETTPASQLAPGPFAGLTPRLTDALKPHARAESPRQERKRLKAERKKARRLQVLAARELASVGPTSNGENGPAAPSANGNLVGPCWPPGWKS